MAQVLDAQEAVAGAGFLVGSDAVLTCAHVVEAAGSGPGKQVRLKFPQLDGMPQVTGQVMAEAWQLPDAQDVAVVQIQSAPDGASVLPLGSAEGCQGHRVSSFGFPRQGPPGGHYGYAVAGDLLHAAAEVGTLLQLTDANDLTTGFSGAPVVDEVTGLVIGMLTQITRPDAYHRGTGVAYATPTQILRQMWPDLAEAEVCPYRGLEVFTAEHAAWFHGRARALDRVVTRLARQRRGLLLLGPSGAGKSSLVQAGILPALAAGRLPGSDQWLQVLTRPGNDLLAELDCAGLPGTAENGITAAVTRALADQPDSARLLLVVDQFEEVLTPPGTDAQAVAQRHVIDQLIDAMGSTVVSILLVLRDDFYPRLAALAPRLLEMLVPGLVNLPATLSGQELHDIIVKPATAVGLRCRDGLVERIITDVLAVDSRAAADGHAPVTVLPLLELALQQLWQRRSDGWLTNQAYQRIGGVAGSLTTWCDTAINRMPTIRLPVAQRILTALVRPADEAYQIPAVRQSVPLSALHDLTVDPGEPDGCTDDNAADEVLGVLTGARIIRIGAMLTSGKTADSPSQVVGGPGEPVAELIHDALIRDWDTLREWVGQDHRFQKWLERAREGGVRWAAAKDSRDLLDGSDLAEGLGWARHRGLPRDVATFLAASERAAQARTRRARILTTVLASLLATALTATALAVWQWRAAVTAQRVALSRQLAAQSTVLIGTDPDLASLLAVQAYRTSPTTEAESSLYAAAALPLRHRLALEGGPVASVAFNPDGRTLATGDWDGRVHILDVVSGHTRAILTGYDSGRLVGQNYGLNSVAYSPDGRTLATGSQEGTVWLWDIATDHLRAALTGPRSDPVRSVAFSPDGLTLAAGSDFGTVRLWDVATGHTHATLTERSGPVYSVAFSPDGRTLATGSADGTVRLWDVATGRQTRVTLADHADAPYSNVNSVTFSPDGRTLATGSADGTVRLWDVATGHSRATLTGHKLGVRSVAFSPDGRTLATGDGDGTVRLLDVATGQTRVTLVGHTTGVGPPGPVWSVAFSPDGRTLATGGDDGTAGLWDVATGQTGATLTRHVGAGSVVFSPDGRSLAITTEDGTVNLWDLATGHIRSSVTGSAYSVAFSPDGRTLAIGDWGGTVRLWDVVTGQVHAILIGHPGTVNGEPVMPSSTSVAFSPDGRTLAVSSQEDALLLWDVGTGHARRAMADQAGDADSVMFSPDGRTLATITANLVQLRDAATGHIHVTLPTGDNPDGSVAFSPDGRILASISGNSTVQLWDVATGVPRITLTADNSVDSVAFSPDGRTVATGGGDGTVQLWDVATGALRSALTGQVGSVDAVAFSPDGRTLATSSGNGTVQLRHLELPDPSTAIAMICQALGNVLTDYFPGPIGSACRS